MRGDDCKIGKALTENRKQAAVWDEHTRTSAHSSYHISNNSFLLSLSFCFQLNSSFFLFCLFVCLFATSFSRLRALFRVVCTVCVYVCMFAPQAHNTRFRNTHKYTPTNQPNLWCLFFMLPTFIFIRLLWILVLYIHSFSSSLSFVPPHFWQSAHSLSLFLRSVVSEFQLRFSILHTILRTTLAAAFVFASS